MPHYGFRALVQNRVETLFLSVSQAHIRADRDLTGLNRVQFPLSFSPVVKIDDCAEPCYFRPQTTGPGRGLLQRPVTGIAARFRPLARSGLRGTPTLAAPCAPPLLSGSHHSAAQGNGRTTATARSSRLPLLRFGHGCDRCGLTRNVETQEAGFKPAAGYNPAPHPGGYSGRTGRVAVLTAEGSSRSLR